MMRSRSCWNAGRTSSSASGRSRPRERALRGGLRRQRSSPRAARATHGCSTRIVLQEARAVRQRPDAEVLGDRLAEIGKRLPCADVGAAPHARAGEQHRHVLARVIGARRRRVVAVIAGDDEQIVARRSRGSTVADPRVDRLEVARRSRRGRSGGRTACRSPPGSRRRARPSSSSAPPARVAMPSVSLVVGRRAGDAAAGEEIADLADRHHLCPAAVRASSSVAPDGSSA